MMSTLSSFNEPEPTLFNIDKIFSSIENSNSNDDPDKQLRVDVKTMGSILGSTIANYEGEDVLNKVESLRLSAKVRENNNMSIGVYMRFEISFNPICPIHRHGVRQEQEEMNLKKKSVTKFSVLCVKLHPLSPLMNLK